jgi:hypothetical protein
MHFHQIKFGKATYLTFSKKINNILLFVFFTHTIHISCFFVLIEKNKKNNTNESENKGDFDRKSLKFNPENINSR